jgi:hypothetical protein
MDHSGIYVTAAVMRALQRPRTRNHRQDVAVPIPRPIPTVLPGWASSHRDFAQSNGTSMEIPASKATNSTSKIKIPAMSATEASRPPLRTTHQKIRKAPIHITPHK